MRRPGRAAAAARALAVALAVVTAVAALLAGCSGDPVSTAPVPNASSEGDGHDSPDGGGVGAPVTAAPAPSGGPQPVSGVGSVAPPPVPTTSKATAAEGGSNSGLPAGFTWSVSSVSASDLPSSWRDGCPVGPSSLRAVTVGYHAMSGGVRTGVLVIHEDMVTPTRRALARLFEIEFPITSIRPVDEFDGDDDRSMAADNTSAFNCRAAVSNGPTSWSNHAYGRAIDINPLINPYILDGEVLPPGGARYTDRDPDVPGMITAGSSALKAFTDNGFAWGGTWSNPDYQHMER